MGGIDARTGYGEGSQSDASQQADVERLKRNPLSGRRHRFDTRRSSTPLLRGTSAAGRTCVGHSLWSLQSSRASRTVTGRVEKPGDFPAESSLRLRPGHLVHQVRGRHIRIALRQMQGQLFVGPEAQMVESTIVLFLAFHRNACLAGARELDLSARWF